MECRYLGGAESPFTGGRALVLAVQRIPFDGGLDCHRRIWYQANYKVNVKGMAIVRDLNPVNMLLTVVHDG